MVCAKQKCFGRNHSRSVGPSTTAAQSIRRVRIHSDCVIASNRAVRFIVVDVLFGLRQKETTCRLTSNKFTGNWAPECYCSTYRRRRYQLLTCSLLVPFLNLEQKKVNTFADVGNRQKTKHCKLTAFELFCRHISNSLKSTESAEKFRTSKLRKLQCEVERFPRKSESFD